MEQFSLTHKTSKFLIILFACTFLLCNALNAQADDSGKYISTMYGIAGVCGYTYDPGDNIYFSQISLYALYDYDKVWPHRAPEPLRFKVEGNLGVAGFDDEPKLLLNIGMLALYYLDHFATDKIRPYVEAGIGLIYTDYRVDNQAFRFNFNPQAGIGFEYNKKRGDLFFVSLRLHHLSNGGLNNDNRGQNSVMLMIGQNF